MPQKVALVTGGAAGIGVRLREEIGARRRGCLLS